MQSRYSESLLLLLALESLEQVRLPFRQVARSMALRAQSTYRLASSHRNQVLEDPPFAAPHRHYQEWVASDTARFPELLGMKQQNCPAGRTLDPQTPLLERTAPQSGVHLQDWASKRQVQVG